MPKATQPMSGRNDYLILKLFPYVQLLSAHQMTSECKLAVTMILLTHQQTTIILPQKALCPSHTPHPFLSQHIYIAPSTWNILPQIPLLLAVSQPSRLCLNISSSFRRFISGFQISCHFRHLLFTTLSYCSLYSPCS